MRLTLVLAAVAAAAASAIPAWSASSPPKLTSFAVTSVARTTSTGSRLHITGTIDCSAAGRFHIWLWVSQPSTGALVHSLVPASLPAKPTTKRIARYDRLSACTGKSKSWVVKSTKSEGTHPFSFTAGRARACAVVTVSHSRRYVLHPTCSKVTIK